MRTRAGRTVNSAVVDTTAAVADALDDPGVPRPIIEEVGQLALAAHDTNRYEIAQSITEVAHTRNADPDLRFHLEQLAGRYIASA